MLKRMLRSNALYKHFILPRRSMHEWQSRKFSGNCPSLVKKEVLLRHAAPNPIWIETGTYYGDTTAFLLRQSRMVYSIEPEPQLFERARERFIGDDHVEIINGVSEVVLPEILPNVAGNVSFWLDGHYSAGETYQGAQDCPVEDELNEISKHMHRFDRFSILIDDVRCFLPENTRYPSYPDITEIVNWANAKGLKWNIEYDILIIRNFSVYETA